MDVPRRQEEDLKMDAVIQEGLEQCKAEVKVGQRYREEIPLIVSQLEESCQGEECFQHVGPEPIPSREAVIDIIHRACRLLFPGYYTRQRLDGANVGYYLGQEAVAFFEALSQQITFSLRHECLRYGLPCTHCQERGQAEALRHAGAAPPAGRPGYGRAGRL